jgi:hypothetical protein
MRIYPYSAIPHRLSDAGDRDTTSMPFRFLDLLLILVEKDLRFFAKSEDIYKNSTKLSSTKILLANLA